MLLKDRLKSLFKEKDWEFEALIDPHTLIFRYKISKYGITFTIHIDNGIVDRLLESESYLHHYIEEVDRHYNNFISSLGA